MRKALPDFQAGFPRRVTVTRCVQGGEAGRLEVVPFPRRREELPLCGFVLLGGREVTFFGSSVTNIVTSRVVGVGVRGWIREGNQWVNGFECFWHMFCV
jgi:hypothetical protein